MGKNIKKLIGSAVAVFAIAALPFVPAGAVTENYGVGIWYDTPDQAFQCNVERDYVVEVSNTTGLGRFNINRIDFESVTVFERTGAPNSSEAFLVTAYNAQSIVDSIAGGNLFVQWLGGPGDVVSAYVSLEGIDEDLSQCPNEPDTPPVPDLKPAKTAVF